MTDPTKKLASESKIQNVSVGKHLDAHYDDPRLAELYDSGNGWSVDRDFYLELAGPLPIRILDLGCGTGLLCDAYAAKGHNVTGVDPASSMLDIAKRKPNGEKIEWVLADSQTYSSGNRFDLIIMTGHAFQVLLSENDMLSTLRVMRDHLDVGGRIVFESRNPEIDWASRWNRTANLIHSAYEISVERRVEERIRDFISFKTSYHFPKQTLVSRSKLRFWTRDEITQSLTDCGLALLELFGDWDKTAFQSTDSEEMIFVAGSANERAPK